MLFLSREEVTEELHANEEIKDISLTKITYKKCVLFHVREKVDEEFHANQEIEEIFRRTNNRHFVGIVSFPKLL